MFAVVWKYEVRPGAEAAFEALYGASDAWVALFRDYAGYIDTQLLRGERARHYLTIDRWDSEAARSRYAEIDAQGDGLTEAERRIGRYTPC